MTTKNALTLYSSGMGFFEREYKLSETPTTFNIPVKRDSIAAVLQTFSFDGGKMVSPPSFPVCAQEPALKIDGSVLHFICNKLRGAKIRVGKAGSSSPVEGRVTGLDSIETDRGTFKTTQNYLCVLDSGNVIQRVRFDDITGYTLTEDRIREEFNKALDYSLESAKPNSVPLTFSLKANERGNVSHVRYGLPLASPKPSHRIRLIGTRFWLDICSVVMNPTDEDWKGIELTVVTGVPLAYDAEDIAQATMPVREKVRLVAQRGHSHVQPKSARPRAAGAQPAAARMLSGSESMLNEGVADFGAGGAADFDTTQEVVGDFAIMTANEPQTIGAGQGALVVLYSCELADAKLVLYYTSANPERAFRTIRAKNSSPYSLMRGNYAIYQQRGKDKDSLCLMGENVLDGVAAGETLLVPHAVETGVKFLREQGQVQSKLTRFNISEGVVKQSFTKECVTYYRVTNNKNEDFNVIIDHDNVLPQSEAKSDAELVEQYDKGHRFSVMVRANSHHVIAVKETKVVTDSLGLGNVEWLRKNIIDIKHPLSTDSSLQALIKLQEEIDAIDRDLSEKQQRVTASEQRCATIRSNLQVGGHGNDMDEWRSSLGNLDRDITKTTIEEIPATNRKKQEATAKLRSALRALAIASDDKK